MALNLGYIKSILGILKLVAIILGIVSYSIGMQAYMQSEYNKGCRDGNGTSSEDPLSTGRTTTLGTTLRTTVRSRGNVIIVDSTTTEAPGNEGPADSIPILWMERFHLCSTGFCSLFGLVYFILHLVKGDFTENKTARGVDFGFHFFGTLWLIVGAIFMAYSALKIDSLSETICMDSESCQLLKGKLVSAGFAFLTAVMYFAICLKSFGKKLYQSV